MIASKPPKMTFEEHSALMKATWNSGALDHTISAVERVDEFTGEIKEYRSTHEPHKDGFTQGQVANCARGDRRSHKGFYWSYFSNFDFKKINKKKGPIPAMECYKDEVLYKQYQFRPQLVSDGYDPDEIVKIC